MAEEKTSNSPSMDQERWEEVKRMNEEAMTLHGALRLIQKDELRQWSAGFDALFVKCRDEEVAERFTKFIKNHALDLHLGHCKTWESGANTPARLRATPFDFWGGKTLYRMKGTWPNWECVGTIHTLYFDLDKLETKEEQAFDYTDFEAKFGDAFPGLDWRDFH